MRALVYVFGPVITSWFYGALAERKMTLPLLIAMERIPGLRDRLRTGDPSPERIPALLAKVQDCGATDAALETARDRVQTGLTALRTLPESPYRNALETLAHHLVDRIA